MNVRVQFYPNPTCLDLKKKTLKENCTVLNCVPTITLTGSGCPEHHTNEHKVWQLLILSNICVEDELLQHVEWLLGQSVLLRVKDPSLVGWVLGSQVLQRRRETPSEYSEKLDDKTVTFNLAAVIAKKLQTNLG